MDDSVSISIAERHPGSVVWYIPKLLQIVDHIIGGLKRIVYMVRKLLHFREFRVSRSMIRRVEGRGGGDGRRNMIQFINRTR